MRADYGDPGLEGRPQALYLAEFGHDLGDSDLTAPGVDEERDSGRAHSIVKPPQSRMRRVDRLGGRQPLDEDCPSLDALLQPVARIRAKRIDRRAWEELAVSLARFEYPGRRDDHLRPPGIDCAVLVIHSVESQNDRPIQLARAHRLGDPSRPIRIRGGTQSGLGDSILQT